MRWPRHDADRTPPSVLPFSTFRFSPSQGVNMTVNKQTLGYLVQLGGIAAFTAGAIASVHHAAIGAAFLGGAAAFYVGQKIRALA